MVKAYGLSARFFWGTIGVEPYCVLVKTFEKDNIGWTVLPFSQNFPITLYGLNAIVFW